MKLIAIFALLFSSTYIYAEGIEDYEYYQAWKELPEDESMGVVYIKSDDPCIILANKSKGTKKRFCELLPSKLNLESDYPTIFPYMLQFDGVVLEFFVVAPWNEQKCKIDLNEEVIHCESTGK